MKELPNNDDVEQAETIQHSPTTVSTPGLSRFARVPTSRELLAAQSTHTNDVHEQNLVSQVDAMMQRQLAVDEVLSSQSKMINTQAANIDELKKWIKQNILVNEGQLELDNALRVRSGSLDDVAK